METNEASSYQPVAATHTALLLLIGTPHPMALLAGIFAADTYSVNSNGNDFKRNPRRFSLRGEDADEMPPQCRHLTRGLCGHCPMGSVKA